MGISLVRNTDWRAAILLGSAVQPNNACSTVFIGWHYLSLDYGMYIIDVFCITYQSHQGIKIAKVINRALKNNSCTLNNSNLVNGRDALRSQYLILTMDTDTWTRCCHKKPSKCENLQEAEQQEDFNIMRPICQSTLGILGQQYSCNCYSCPEQ